MCAKIRSSIFSARFFEISTTIIPLIYSLLICYIYIRKHPHKVKVYFKSKIKKIKSKEIFIANENYQELQFSYEEIKLENGVVGQKRYDLIVSHFETDGVNEKHEIKVISGEGETIPQYTNSDTFNGGTVSEMPLYLVEIDGISIKSVKSQFDIIPNLQELIDKMIMYKE